VGASWSSLWQERARDDRVLPPFRSALAAQCWLEWRLRRWGILIVVMLFTAASLTEMHLTVLAVQKPGFEDFFRSWSQTLALLGPAWFALLYAAKFPVLMPLLLGMDLGGLPRDRHGNRLDFFLTRPSNVRLIVLSKLWLVAVVQVLTGVVMVVVGGLWAVCEGYAGDMADRLVAVMGSPGAALLAVVGCVLGVLVFGAAHLIKNLWVGLSGRSWLTVTVLMVSLIVWVGAILVWQWVTSTPERYEWGAAILPGVLTAGVVLKGALAAGVLSVLYRRSLATVGEITGGLVIWGMVVVGLFSLVAWLVPAEVVSRGVLAGVVVLLVPLARCGLAPLAVGWNRHR
jgi:hypothetical protein